jgi:SARP family transcriptional regulator, regulator of embCAB operon
VRAVPLAVSRRGDPAVVSDDRARGAETRIHWLDPDGGEHVHELGAGAGPVTIGRRKTNEIPVPWDPEVSRVHAELEPVGAYWTVRDDGLSRNGTWVNGDRLRGRRRLVNGDTLKVGNTLLVVRERAALDSVLTVGATSSHDDLGPASARVRVNLCGPLVLEIDGRRRETELSGRKGRRLFAYLVSRRNQTVRREQLIDVLWPRTRPTSPEEGLNVHITRLRTVLGKQAIVGRSEVRLALGEDATVDVEAASAWQEEAHRRFAGGDHASAIGAARAALGVLEQDFMPEFDDDEWVRELRIELQDAVPQLLEIEAEAALALGGAELPLAEAASTALLALRPYRESDYRLLMRAHAASGNVAEALLVYERLRLRLIDDLGVPPAAETRVLYERLISSGG